MEDHFNLSEMKIMEAHKDKYFAEHTEEKFKKSICKFNVFTDNHILFTNRSKTNKNQNSIINIKTSTM